MEFVRKRRWLLAGVTGAILAAALMTYQPAQPAKAAQTLRFFAPWGQTQFHEVDVNEEGRRLPGDVETGRFILNKRGDKVGTFVFVCTYVTLDPVRQVCEGGVRVNGKGEIFIGAAPERVNTNRTNVVVAGGTGAYEGATGTAELDFRGRRGAHITLRLR